MWRLKLKIRRAPNLLKWLLFTFLLSVSSGLHDRLSWFYSCTRMRHSRAVLQEHWIDVTFWKKNGWSTLHFWRVQLYNSKFASLQTRGEWQMYVRKGVVLPQVSTELHSVQMFFFILWFGSFWPSIHLFINRSNTCKTVIEVQKWLQLLNV